MVPRWAIVAILLCGLVAVGQSQYVTTIAGSAGTSGHANGPGAAATFFHPAFLAATSTDLYIADYGNNLIRKIDLASSNVTTIAGGGSSGTDWGHADGIGTSATFNEPYGIAVSGNDLYVSDYLNNLIRHVDLTSREVKTIAGGGVNFLTYNSIGAAAMFMSPIGIAVSGNDLYVCDYEFGLIRHIDCTTNEVTTFVGGGPSGIYFSGNADGAGTSSATFYHPYGVAVSGNDMYIADSGNNLIRHVDLTTREVKTIAGGGSSGTESGYADGTGTSATFHLPTNLTLVGNLLFIVDGFNNRVRQLDLTTLMVTTFAGGEGGNARSADGNGTEARFAFPHGIAFSGSDLYVGDFGNHEIRKIMHLGQ